MNRLRAILALYVFVWFNVVVPGHTRGKITLKTDAEVAPSAIADSCCSTPRDRDAGDSDPDPKPRPKSKSPCAVCYVAATYAPVVPVVFDCSPGEWTGVAVAEYTGDLTARGVELAIYPTGPPSQARSSLPA